MFEVLLLDKAIYKEEDIQVLRNHAAKKRKQMERPILVFLCGGDEQHHSSRGQIRKYVENSSNNELNNVFFLSAENIAKSYEMSEFDLLRQEAIISDISDWLLIIAESVGSFCELGAFSSLPHSVSITAVIVDRKYKNSNSFLMKGPVRVIDKSDAPLSQVFYSNLDCPMANYRFASFVRNIRQKVKASDLYFKNKGRKSINLDANDIKVGSFAHEMLDLITLFEPISMQELIELYCRIKRFSQQKMRITSTTLYEDMRTEGTIKPQQVLAAMLASGLISEKVADGVALFYSKVHLTKFFMFNKTNEEDFLNTHAKILLRRRRKGYFYEKDFYRRFD